MSIKAPRLRSIHGGRVAAVRGPVRIPPAPRDNPARVRGRRVRSNPITVGDVEQLELNPQSIDADMRELLRITKEDAKRYAKAEDERSVSEEALRGLVLQVYEDAAYAAALWRTMTFYAPESRDEAFAHIRDDVKRAMSFARSRISDIEIAPVPGAGYSGMGSDPFRLISKATGDATATAMFETIVYILDTVTGGEIVADDELVGDTWRAIFMDRNAPPRVTTLLAAIKQQGRDIAERLADRGEPYNVISNVTWGMGLATDVFRDEMGRAPMRMEILSSDLSEYFTEGLAEEMGLTMGEQDINDAGRESGLTEEFWAENAWGELASLGLDEWPDSARQAFVRGYMRSVSEYWQR
jgi:hypothetical protein